MNPSNGNPGKPGETIFAKYFNGLRETNVRLGGIDEAAVRLAMHLAITDALALREPAPPACHVSNATDQRIAEWQQSQIGRLNEWLEENHPALYHSPSHDTAGAMIHLYEEVSRELIQMKRADAEGHAAMLQLRAELASALADVTALGEELRKAEAMTAVLRQQRASLQEDLDATQQAREDNRQEVQQLRQELTQALQRAAVVDPTPAPDWGPSHPAWQGLTAMEQETVSRLATGEIKWRTLSKALRRDLATRALQHLSAGRAISSGAFDKTRPSWMPTANTLGATVAQSWSDLQAAASAA